jgi:hypothetical protein
MRLYQPAVLGEAAHDPPGKGILAGAADPAAFHAALP